MLENWLEMEGDSCVMKRGCKATELSVQVGEVVTVQFQESGWGWVAKDGGESSWVPLGNLGPDT